MVFESLELFTQNERYESNMNTIRQALILTAKRGKKRRRLDLKILTGNSRLPGKTDSGKAAEGTV
jgi:hypothetical protein